MTPRGVFLPDVNVLVALTDESHVHHTVAQKWFDAEGHRAWALCPLTEAGLLRVITRQQVGGRSMEEATKILHQMGRHRGCRYWPLTVGWEEIAAPLSSRIFGHQQITDAWLLGLAIREHGVLVSFDRALKYLASDDFTRHLLVLG